MDRDHDHDHEQDGPEAPMLQNGGAGAGAQVVPAQPTKAVDQPRASLWGPGGRRQLIAATACFLLTAGCGYPIGFSAVMLPQLRNNDSVLPTNEDMESWIASVHSAATPLGALLSSRSAEYVGRRFTLQMTALPFLVGWCLLAFAQSYPMVLAGRLVCGFAVGVTASPCQVYLGEIADPHLRGLLGGLPMLSYSIGILLVYALGTCLDWHIVAATGPLLPLISVVAFCFIPKSPIWLVRKGNFASAKKALSWFRGGRKVSNQQINLEFDEMVRRAAVDNQQKSWVESNLKVFLQPQVYKPLIVVNLLSMMQIVSGTFLVIFYGVDIVVESASSAGSSLSGYLFSVVVAVVRMAFCGVGCCLLLWWPRRRQAMVSGALSALAALALGAACLVKAQRPPAQPAPAAEFYVIAALLLFYVATNTAGFFMLPVVTIGEYLPARVRGTAGGYTFFLFNTALFAATKLFPYIKDHIGIAGVFLVFGFSSLLGTLMVYLLMPETKGRTLNEVEDYFAGENFMWITRNRRRSIRPSSPLPKI